MPLESRKLLRSCCSVCGTRALKRSANSTPIHGRPAVSHVGFEGSALSNAALKHSSSCARRESMLLDYKACPGALTSFELCSGKDSPGYQNCHTSCSDSEDYIDDSAKWAQQPSDKEGDYESNDHIQNELESIRHAKTPYTVANPSRQSLSDWCLKLFFSSSLYSEDLIFS